MTSPSTTAKEAHCSENVLGSTNRLRWLTLRHSSGILRRNCDRLTCLKSWSIQFVSSSCLYTSSPQFVKQSKVYTKSTIVSIWKISVIIRGILSPEPLKVVFFTFCKSVGQRGHVGLICFESAKRKQPRPPISRPILQNTTAVVVCHSGSVQVWETFSFALVFPKLYRQTLTAGPAVTPDPARVTGCALFTIQGR